MGPCPGDKNGGQELLGGWDITVFSDVAAVELPNALAGSSTLTPMEVTLVKPSDSQRKQKGLQSSRGVRKTKDGRGRSMTRLYHTGEQNCQRTNKF